MTWKEGSDMITFDKADMDKALKKISHWFDDDHSSRFWLGERFPVRFWHDEDGLTFYGKDRDIGLANNKLKVKKGVRLR